MENSNRNTVRPVVRMARIALFAAWMGVFSQIQIPLPGLVPLSLASFVTYLSVEILDWKEASVSHVIYILLGAVGVPVFSGFGTLSRLVGPTGGYIVGYAACAFVGGLILSKTGKRIGWSITAHIVGTVVLYVIGTIWYVVVTGSSAAAALTACVFPFLPGDAIKIVLAVVVGNRLRKVLPR
ncbi:MAG: biotin transporter BioY [Candidatus Merdivicinus sp.]|jgi:biotin transport system substrate-specific component